MTNGQRLQDRRILITGGAGGIGAAAVRRLSAEGAAVAVLDRDVDAAQRLAADVDRTVAFEADVTRPESVDAAVSAAAQELGGLDGVLTCAGIARSGLPHEMSLDDWYSVIDINLNGTFLAVRAALPHLLEADAASVVTIGSVASLISANTNTCGYDASKSGVLGLTRSIAVGYADRGVRANCLCPGVVDTPLARRAREVEGVTSNAVAATPLGRRAEPEEMAGIIAFLLSAESSYMTGSVVTADGGLTAR
ncbi:SDR family NAD(P)-dependent oxidoreductase [Nocardia vermiculata]|uniref:SDR family oxidoreductase n=1 Tax=Nocardia vermiculata TaxID=257274 RepID=A0A846Y1U7_9NOCA|nr:SDR family NAD(P)-dependent oxidoreductase [Nocardia vermiculata]NKY51671.1 SDR family oxidoreductase [Nocardia vermiculata]